MARQTPSEWNDVNIGVNLISHAKQVQSMPAHEHLILNFPNELTASLSIMGPFFCASMLGFI